MITNVKLRKMLSKGCMVYLAHIVKKTNDTILDLSKTPIIYEYPNVFPNSLSRLALECKVEFNIELAPRIVSISKGI